MLVAICGPTCSGKTSVADFLVNQLNFERLLLLSPHANLEYSVNQISQNGTLKGQETGPDDVDGRKTDALPRTFKSCAEIVEYVMADGNWGRKMVVDSLRNVRALDAFRRRPFFLLIGVDAPIQLRYNRYAQRFEKGEVPMTLQDFVNGDYAQFVDVHRMLHSADLRILNTTSSSEAFSSHLENLNIANPDRLRPSWDTYFMLLSFLAARRSNCMKRRVGCIVVRDKRVIATGYNGTPRGVRNCNEGGCARCNDSGVVSGAGLDTCLCLHAEENALLEAGRERIESRLAEGAPTVLYCNTCPCLGCAKKIVQVGIKEVVYAQEYKMDEMTKSLLMEAGVSLRCHKIPEESFWIDEGGSLGAAELIENSLGGIAWALEARIG
ncbi:hypothetical protein M427DRAFT_151950 [Gonapodya prolifera JEL478]|uniref:Deoxycytidylate deaminase n=1 Tax=Gonapodya prolifera (strain JEL478) TaxID=1344416 RepID=A0A139AVD2_GONPJ|nr:hypothetical protein M427DRAFT_151950 [Gonapodya prolifera JEL478]|eukprot:KXS20678.1 hypothetical protein M427DRAFT_151950 [Gonapodya prolifera JEL478]